MNRWRKRFRNLAWASVPLLALPFLAVWYEHHKVVTFLKNDPFYQLDSMAGHLHTPDTSRIFDWPEHPHQKVVLRTNNLGFREDNPTETIATTGTKRVLVVGDSHTDGVVNNFESFPNVAEQALGKPFEIINGGTGFYTFQNYAGFVERFADLEPQTYVVAIYAGNDFLETVLLDSASMDIGPALQTSWYRVRKKLQQASNGLVSTQGHNQELFFSMYPEKKAHAIALATSYLQRTKTFCANNEIELFVLILPAASMLDSAAHQAENEALLQQLEASLGELNIPYHNLTAELAAEDYWQEDLHLNVSGHAKVGKWLAAHLSK